MTDDDTSVRFLVALAVFAALAVPSTAAAADSDCRLQTRPGGVECVTDDGTVQWEYEHPGLWQTFEDYRRGNDRASEPIGPIRVGDAVLYAARRHLLEVDPEAGTIVDRARFPAPIEILVADGDEVDVVVRDHFEDTPVGDDPEEVSIRYRPGDPSPPQGTWSAPEQRDRYLSSRDADWRARGAGGEQQALELLRRTRDIDPTNPFLSQEIGEILDDRDEREAALRAFERAAGSPEAVWRDLLAVSSRLEESDAAEPADRAFRRGLESMRQAGVDPERLTSLVGMATTLMAPTGPDSSLVEALQAADPDEVDRLMTRFARLAPYVESGHYNFETLANWMVDQGEERLAEKWRRIADENRRYAYERFTRNVVQIDRTILALVSAGVALVLLALLIGMRGGLARRRRVERGDRDQNLWLPKLRFRDLIVPALLFVTVVALPYYLDMHATVVDRLSEAPTATSQDGLASPATIQWLESLTDSSPVEDLVSTALAEQRALQRGEQLPPKDPVVHTVIEALYEDARHQQIDRLRRGRMPDLVATVRTFGDDRVAGPGEKTLSLGFALAIPGLFALLLFVGTAIGARAPRVARPVTVVVPGGSDRLAPIGALMLVALVAAFLAHTGLDSAVYQASQPSFLKYFGLESIEEHTPSPSRWWARITLAVVVLYQTGVVVWETRRRD